MTAGRPTDYDKKLHPKLVEKCYKDRMTNEEVAEYMEISTSTLHKWKTEHKEFSSAIERGSNKDLLSSRRSDKG